MSIEKLRVLFTTNIPSPYRVDFFNELGKLCDLTVTFERKDSSNREDNWYNYQFDNFEAIFLDGYAIKSDHFLSFEIRDYLKKELFDIFIIGGYSTPTGMLAIQTLNNRNIPFVLNTDGGLIKEDNFLKYQIKKYFIGSADYWLSTGEVTTDYLTHYGATKEKVFLYPFTSLMNQDILEEPVDDKTKKEIKKTLGMEEEKIVLSVGQFIYRKGFDVLMEAATELESNTGVYIVGGEPPSEYIELKDKFNLDNVHFVDFKLNEILQKYYMASDLFVLPTREDVWGLVINEAMAAGLPVITTDRCVAGLELVRDDENGYIVPVENVDELSQKMNRVLSQKKLREKISKENTTKIKKYTIEEMAQEHLDILEKINQFSK